MSAHLPTKEQVLHQLQHQTEIWLMNASSKQILDRLALLHGMLAEDLIHIRCGRWDAQRTGAASCSRCEDFVLACMTVALTARPNLIGLLPKADHPNSVITPAHQ
jgi:hypothetical protein